MIIASIDPGAKKPNAISIFNSNNLINTYLVKDSTYFYNIMKLEKVEQAYIEDQFFSVNPLTLKELARETGKLVGILELLGISHEFITPSTWQNWHNLPKKPRKTKKNPDVILLSDYQWKKKHAQDQIDLANKYSNKEVVHEDIAASILIGIYVTRRNNE